MGDKGEKSRSFATLRMTLIGVGMTGIASGMTVIGIERVETAGAIRCVARLRGKHERFYHEISKNVK
jgi:hypothetical protein